MPLPPLAASNARMIAGRQRRTSASSSGERTSEVRRPRSTSARERWPLPFGSNVSNSAHRAGRSSGAVGSRAVSADIAESADGGGAAGVATAASGR
eukprot:4743051-Prymnesium_polylepis.1